MYVIWIIALIGLSSVQLHEVRLVWALLGELLSEEMNPLSGTIWRFVLHWSLDSFMDVTLEHIPQNSLEVLKQTKCETSKLLFSSCPPSLG